MKQEKIILDAGFPCALYELEKALKDGWEISQEREPIYIAGMYEIVVVKENRTENNEGDTIGGDGTEVAPENQPAQEATKRGPKPKGK